MVAIAALVLPFALAAPQTAQPMQITFVGCSAISASGRQMIQVVAKALNSPALVTRRMIVVGYAEAMGDQQKELAASRARAEQVQAALIELGVDAPRLAVQGMGAAEPVEDLLPQDTENCRAELRLVR